MLMNEMLMRTRFYANDIEEKEYEETEVLMALNAAKEFLASILVERDPGAFRSTTSLTPVADQSGYLLPAGTRGIEEVVFGSTGVTPIVYQVYTIIGSDERHYEWNEYVAWVEGGYIYLNPAPTADAINLYSGARILVSYLAGVPDAYSSLVEWNIPAILAQIIPIKAAILLLASHMKDTRFLDGQYQEAFKMFMEAGKSVKSSPTQMTGMKYGRSARYGNGTRGFRWR